MLAAHMEYGLGNWTSSAATAEAGLVLHSRFVATLDLDDHRVERMMHELAWVYLAGRDLLPPLGAKVRKLLERAGMWDVVSGSTATTDQRSAEEWLSMVNGQLHGEWMGDMKNEVHIAFVWQTSKTCPTSR